MGLGKISKRFFNHLMPKAEKCSDRAENLTKDSSRYSKNLSFYPFIFLSRTVKKLSRKIFFEFSNISESALL
jgi:hypothetical protein